jgi:hypothetical protein
VLYQLRALCPLQALYLPQALCLPQALYSPQALIQSVRLELLLRQLWQLLLQKVR